MASFVPGRDMLLKGWPAAARLSGSSEPRERLSRCRRKALRPPKFGRHSATWALVDGAIRIANAGCPEPAPVGDQAAAPLMYLELRDPAQVPPHHPSVYTRASQPPAQLAASRSLRVSELLTIPNRDCFCSKNAFSEQSALARSDAPTLWCAHGFPRKLISP
jgi:hypothetical protein